MSDLPNFDSLYRRAVLRHGEEALAERLPKPKSARSLKRIPDDRYLSMMTKRVFQSGFVWRVIENKWDHFETVFHGFDPARLAVQPIDDYEALMEDRGIVRHRKKIYSVRDNARFVFDVAEEHGSFGRFLADWPGVDAVGLFEVLKRQGSRLGGRTGQNFLRSMGKDTFVLSKDVVGSLIREGIVAKPPTSKRDLQTVQDSFNSWSEQSGRPLCEISMILACGFGE